MKSACRRLAVFALPVFLLAGGPCFAAGANWVEPKFDPPVGSKWVIQHEVNVQKNVRGTMIGHTLKETALLTVEEKTADGYVMTYERQNSSYEGDPAGASVYRIAYAAEKGVPLKIITDGNGNPLRVTNFDELKSALKAAIDELPMGTARSDVVASMRKVAERMALVDDKQAAQLYLNGLPLLALTQNTGLQPGDTRTATVPVANGLVSGMTKVVTMSIAKDDPSNGKVRYLMTETFDPDSMKTLIGETIKELNPTTVNASNMDQAMKSATVVSTARAQADVAEGMTRELRRQVVTSFRATGAYSVTTEDELITVSPAGTAATD